MKKEGKDKKMLKNVEDMCIYWVCIYCMIEGYSD